MAREMVLRVAMRMWGRDVSGVDGGEVLHVVAVVAAQVLDQGGAARHRWPGVSGGLCLAPARRTPGRIPAGRQIKAAALRHQCPQMQLSARRPAQNLLAAQSRSQEESRCPLDWDLDDSDAALDGGMRKGCYRL